MTIKVVEFRRTESTEAARKRYTKSYNAQCDADIHFVLGSNKMFAYIDCETDEEARNHCRQFGEILSVKVLTNV